MESTGYNPTAAMPRPRSSHLLPAIALAALGLLACSTPPDPPATASGMAMTPPTTPTTTQTTRSAAIASAAPQIPAPPTTTGTADRLTPSEVEELLFLREADRDPSVLPCRAEADEGARIRCLITARYSSDPAAARDALALHIRFGGVAGLLPEERMNGGFRGQIHLVPEAPVGKERRHLAWITAANEDFEDFFTGLARGAPAIVNYRFRDIAYRFFRSVKRTTPSAYADGWTVAYNVAGSLHTSADTVRETLFHELFHLNDAAHHGWSGRALRPIFDAIVQKCGAQTHCLQPFAPNVTMVRGGTYYAFQPNNGDAVREYAAELALRYYRDNRAAMRGLALKGKGFKCGPPENRRAWEALASEFFGGVDRTPSCPP